MMAIVIFVLGSFVAFVGWRGRVVADSVVLVLLAINGIISVTGFGGDKTAFRTTHAYLGTAAIGILFVHAILGLKLGLSI